MWKQRLHKWRARASRWGHHILGWPAVLVVALDSFKEIDLTPLLGDYAAGKVAASVGVAIVILKFGPLLYSSEAAPLMKEESDVHDVAP